MNSFPLMMAVIVTERMEIPTQYPYAIAAKGFDVGNVYSLIK